jgi:hypothetical protein
MIITGSRKHIFHSMGSGDIVIKYNISLDKDTWRDVQVIFSVKQPEIPPPCSIDLPFQGPIPERRPGTTWRHASSSFSKKISLTSHLLSVFMRSM